MLVSALQHSPAWGWEQRWANDDISPEYLAIGQGRAVCVDGQRHCEFLICVCQAWSQALGCSECTDPPPRVLWSNHEG